MKKVVCIALMSLLVFGCSAPSNGKTAIKIDSVKISVSEFDQAFSLSNLADGDKSAKREFLDILVSRKLILKEAENLGLDKDTEFLQDIQLFWEQSLLKRILSRKVEQIEKDAKVENEEISAYYIANSADQFPQKSLEDVHDQIQLLLSKQKQKQLMQEWINSLKEKAKIKIDYDLLQIEED
ncbi:MAG: hypothetical protein GY858_03875 [Candidatus Omnitrophica bacterium]|nr:hypothetical protein [Candidatus Omnitrophota bacterium]